MAFNTVLKSLRIKKDMTQEDLARATGLTKSAIGMYEAGLREPKFEVLEIFADYFNVDMNTLLDKKTPETGYYINPETAKIAQEIYDNPGKRALFDALRNAKPNTLLAIKTLIDTNTKEFNEEDENQDAGTTAPEDESQVTKSNDK